LFPYRMDVATEEDLDGDPFGGRGVWLASPGGGATEMLIRLEVIFGETLAAVASPTKGVWVDGRQTRITPDELVRRWAWRA
jgi:hypothetical protein